MADQYLPRLLQRAIQLVMRAPVLTPLAVGIRWGWVFYRELSRDRAFVRAAGMAYATLVALVPMLVLVFGILGALGELGRSREITFALFDQFFGEVPGVQEVLLPGLLGVDLGALGLAATGGLLLVAARLYLMVENAYCDIFGVTNRRPFLVRLLNFYFTITAIPVALVFLVGATLDLATGLGYGVLRGWAALTLQFILLVAAIKLLPSVRVRWWPAFLGAGVSWVLLELGRRGFSLYIRWFASDDPLRVVYGSLGLIPLFLVWIYLFWIFVLLGVEVANVAQNFPSLVAAELEAHESERVRYPSTEDALRTAAWIAWSFETGRGPIPTEELIQRSRLRGRALSDVLGVLVDGDVVLPSETGWMPARPADQIPLDQVVEVWRRQTRVDSATDEPVAQEVAATLRLRGSLADGVERWISRADGPTPQPRLLPEASG